MAARKSSRVNRKYKTKYRIRNWREYERALRSRGDVTIWLSAEAIAAWTQPKNGLRGGQRRYSDLAILTALTLRLVFRLPLRQTEGFLDSLPSWMGLDLKAPDHTTLSRRNRIVEVQLLTRGRQAPEAPGRPGTLARGRRRPAAADRRIPPAGRRAADRADRERHRTLGPGLGAGRAVPASERADRQGLPRRQFRVADVRSRAARVRRPPSSRRAACIRRPQAPSHRRSPPAR